MNIRLQIFLSISAVLFLFYTIQSIRRKGLDLYHSMIWLAGAVVLLLGAVFPGPVMALAKLVGVTAPSNYVFFLMIAILMLASISMSTALSRQHSRIRSMVQSMAILEKRLEEAEQQILEFRGDQMEAPPAGEALKQQGAAAGSSNIR